MGGLGEACINSVVYSSASLHFIAWNIRLIHFLPSKIINWTKKWEGSHLIFKSLVSFSQAWGSTVYSSLPIQLFDSPSVPWRLACSAGTLFIAPCKKNKWKHKEDCQSAFVGVVSRLKKSQEKHCFHPAKCWRCCIFYQPTCGREREICARGRGLGSFVNCLCIWVWFISKYGKPVLPTHLKINGEKFSLVSKMFKTNTSEADLD